MLFSCKCSFWTKFIMLIQFEFISIIKCNKIKCEPLSYTSESLLVLTYGLISWLKDWLTEAQFWCANASMCGLIHMRWSAGRGVGLWNWCLAYIIKSCWNIDKLSSSVIFFRLMAQMEVGSLLYYKRHGASSEWFFFTVKNRIFNKTVFL